MQAACREVGPWGPVRFARKGGMHGQPVAREPPEGDNGTDNYGKRRRGLWAVGGDFYLLITRRAYVYVPKERSILNTHRRDHGSETYNNKRESTNINRPENP